MQETNTQPLVVSENGLANLQQNEAIEKFRIACQNFTTKANKQPPPESVDPTPDGKAFTILIDHIETTLDEYFFGLWSTENFKWSVIANEVVGSLDLVVIHPVNGMTLRRTGAAAVQIQVHKVPDNLTPQERTMWANNPDNKKSNALDMGFPKLKSECLKNAANSLGKLFGRSLNRKKADEYKPLIKADVIKSQQDSRITSFINAATTIEQLAELDSVDLTPYQKVLLNRTKAELNGK